MTSSELTMTDTLPRLRVDGTLPLSTELVTALNAFIDQVEDSGEGASVLHLSGAPAVPVDQGRLDIHLVNKWERAVRRLERAKAATVAVVTGDCGGVALELLLAADIRLATADARLLVPAGSGAVWPGMGLYRLANQVGPTRIRRTVLFGLPITAAEAVELTVVDQIVDSEEAVQESEIALVTGLVADAGAELAIRRQLMLDATTTSFEEALGKHLAACDRTLRRGTDRQPAVR